MNRDDILKMEVGRELDALITDKIMDGTIWRYTNGAVADPTPHYSTDIAAAWEVVDKLGLTFELRQLFNNGKKHYDACFISNEIPLIREAEAPTAPLAICKAALLAVMEAQ